MLGASRECGGASWEVALCVTRKMDGRGNSQHCCSKIGPRLLGWEASPGSACERRIIQHLQIIMGGILLILQINCGIKKKNQLNGTTMKTPGTNRLDERVLFVLRLGL